MIWFVSDYANLPTIWVTILDVGNCIGVEGAKSIAAALKTNNTIKSIGLRGKLYF